MKLSDKQINFIRLIERSPDVGQGWRNVSNALKPLLDMVVAERPELYETKSESKVSSVKLSERGQILRDYI